MSNNKLFKIAAFGAVSALLIDYMFKPTLARTMGLR